MPSVASCPNCGQKVTVPEGLASDAAVRCPLCHAEFPLDQVQPDAAEMPPALVPVETASPEGDDGLSLAVDDTLDDTLDDAIDLPAAPTEPPAAATEVADASEGYALEGEHPDRHGAAHAEGAEEYDFGYHPPEGGAGAASVWRRSVEEPSLVGQLAKFVGIMVCGLLGIAVAYFVLSLISPRHFDYLHIWGQPAPKAEKAPSGRLVAPAAEKRPDDTKADWSGLH